MSPFLSLQIPPHEIRIVQSSSNTANTTIPAYHAPMISMENRDHFSEQNLNHHIEITTVAVSIREGRYEYSAYSVSKLSDNEFSVNE
jgi:hypothetical protein